MFAGNGRQRQHAVNFGIEFWVPDHGDEEQARPQRVASVHQFVPTADGQDVMDAGRNIEIADLVPPVSLDNKVDNENDSYKPFKRIDPHCFI